MYNKRTLVNLYKNSVDSDPCTHFLYDIVTNNNIKVVVHMHAFLFDHSLDNEKLERVDICQSFDS